MFNKIFMTVMYWIMRIIDLGFWPGGDRDGNPFVTTEITLKVAERLRQTYLRNYYRDVQKTEKKIDI